jgi:hypothetical protein
MWWNSSKQQGGKPEQAVGLYQGRRTIEYYARFIELWRECDPVLRPLAEQADSARLTLLQRDR